MSAVAIVLTVWLAHPVVTLPAYGLWVEWDARRKTRFDRRLGELWVRHGGTLAL